MHLSLLLTLCASPLAWAHVLGWNPGWSPDEISDCTTERGPTYCQNILTKTKTALVVKRPKTITASSISTFTKTETLKKETRTVKAALVATETTSSTTTKTITSFTKTVSTTKTVVETSTIPTLAGWRPGADTIKGYTGPRGKRSIHERPEEDEQCACDDDTKHDCKVTRTKEVLKTYTPRPKFKTIRHTKTATFQVQPVLSTTVTVKTTATITNRFTSTATIHTATTTISTQTSRATFYAACAANNIIQSGPNKGGPIIDVYNRGKKGATVYDTAQGTFKTPYDCCVACQQSKFCTGWVARTGESFCLLLRNDDRTCKAQSAASAFYVDKLGGRAAGLVVGNGPCGYQYYGGSS